MASLITHPAVPLAVACIVGRKIVPLPLLFLGIVFSMLPDADSIGFRFGVRYESEFGHRGFSHSIFFALLCATSALPWIAKLGAKRLPAFLFLFVAMISHGVLDAFTREGNGVAFFWPFNLKRIFFDFHPVEASPISVRRFMSARGVDILQSELIWIWAPLMLLAIVGYGVRKRSQISSKH